MVWALLHHVAFGAVSFQSYIVILCLQSTGGFGRFSSVWYNAKAAAAQQDLLFHSMALVMYVACPGEHKSIRVPGAA